MRKNVWMKLSIALVAPLLAGNYGRRAAGGKERGGMGMMQGDSGDEKGRRGRLGGVLNRTINSGTSNDGSYSWAIPLTQAIGTNYKMRVTSTINPAYTDTSNNNFTITV